MKRWVRYKFPSLMRLFKILEGDISSATQVRIKVQTCRSDSITKWTSGSRYGVLSGVRSMNKIFPLERAQEVYEIVISGKARFRVVLTTGH